MKLKKNDEIVILKGKDKGKKGKIEKIFSKENVVLVPGLNVFKRHKKARMQNQQSEIIEIVKPLPVSNVSLVCPNCHKVTRIGYKFENKEKIRVCRKCDKKI